MTGRVRDYVYRDEEGRPLRTRDVQAMAARFTPLDKARLQAGQKSAWSTDAGSVADSIPPTADFFGDRARDSESEVSEGGDEDDDPTQRGLSPRDGLIGQGAKSLPQPAPVAVHKVKPDKSMLNGIALDLTQTGSSQNSYTLLNRNRKPHLGRQSIVTMRQYPEDRSLTLPPTRIGRQYTP